MLVDNEDVLESHLIEKDVLLGCESPFLINMEYLFQNDLRLYYVMPYVHGCELYSYFESSRQLSVDTIVFLAAQMILAIGDLHKIGIAHRDLKLENVMIDSSGYIRVIDYGLAKRFGRNEICTDLVGTLSYMAPEMVNRKGHNMAIDWWALGIILHELYLGFTPFVAPTKYQRYAKIQKEQITIPDEKKQTKT